MKGGYNNKKGYGGKGKGGKGNGGGGKGKNQWMGLPPMFGGAFPAMGIPGMGPMGPMGMMDNAKLGKENKGTRNKGGKLPCQWLLLYFRSEVRAFDIWVGSRIRNELQFGGLPKKLEESDFGWTSQRCRSFGGDDPTNLIKREEPLTMQTAEWDSSIPRAGQKRGGS